MAAPKGNDYNLKWTLEKAYEFFDDVLDEVIKGDENYTLGSAAVEVGQYEELINYLENKFPDEDFKSLKKARNIIKDRLIWRGLYNKVNTAMAIFVLKNNHGMADKTDANVNLHTEQPLYPDDISKDNSNQ